MDQISVEALGDYGIPREIICCLQSSGMQELLPLQAEAVRHPELRSGQNILVLGPTSAGKTFVGEMAALRQWQAGRKAIFLTPTRALTAGQHLDLQSRYGPAGIRCLFSTADHTRHDGAIRRGEFDFAVMVYEKFRSFLVSCPDLLSMVGVVVADELQILYDATRGETADLVLSRLMRTEPAVQIVGLSAVLEDPERVATWLDARVLKSEVRPTELREGIFCLEHDVFHYRAAGAGPWQDESLPGHNQPDLEDAASCGAPAEAAGCIVHAAVRLARAGENCLVFVPTRAMSRQVAAAVAAKLEAAHGIAGIDDRSGAPAPRLEITMAEDSIARRQLAQCLPTGVAFHNADLTADLRSLVEQGFNDASIRVLVATPTLAQGVNLRAHNVIQVPLMMKSPGPGASARPCPEVPLSLERYRNQAGRAGRLGSGEAFGRSILVAPSHREATRLARTYVEAAPQGNPAAQEAGELHHFILDCIDSGTATTFSAIYGAFATTFAGHGDDGKDAARLEHDLGESVREMLEWELVDESPCHRLRLTGLGQVMAVHGLRAQTIHEMRAWCQEWKHGEAPPVLEILLACAATADGETFALSASPAEIKSGYWLRHAHCFLSEDALQQRPGLGRVLKPKGGLSRTAHATVKLAVLCHEWITPRATVELEEQLHTVAGTLASAAAHVAWIASGMAACATLAGCESTLVDGLRQVAARLPQGLSARAAGLAALQVPGLTRNYLHRLVAEGLDSPEALWEADDTLGCSLVPPPVWQALKAVLAATLPHLTGPSEVPASDPLPYHAAAPGALAVAEPAPEPLFAAQPAGLSAPPVGAEQAGGFDLIVDDNDPGTVIFHGQRVQLSPKPYALLGFWLVTAAPR